MFDTTEKRLALIMLSVLAYLSLPLVFGLWLMGEQNAGAFPLDGETIAIPFFGFLLVWIFFFPSLIIFGYLVESLGQKFYGSDR